MKNIVFVCHGNICRSVAMEWIFIDLIRKYGVSEYFNVLSRATSLEEIGNPIYPPMKRELIHEDIPFGEHRAQRISKEDYDWADYIFYMDHENLWSLKRLINDSENKFYPVSIWTEGIDDIDDPWYSGEYHIVIEQLKRCAEDIIAHLLNN